MYVAGMDGRLDQLQGVVDAVAGSTGCPATLEDRDLNLVVSSGHEDVIDEVRSASILRRRSSAEVQALFGAFGIARSEGPMRIPGDPASGRLGRWCVPVRRRQVTYGYLWLLDPAEQVPLEQLERLADVVDQAAAVMALRSRSAERTSWAVGELLSDDAQARARALDELRAHGALPRGGRVFVAALAPRREGELGPVNTWLLPHAVIAAPVDRWAALVIPERAALAPATVVGRVARSLLPQHPEGVAGGVSGPVEPAAAQLGRRQAGACLGVALRRLADGGPGPDAVVQDWAGLGVRRLLAVADAAALTAALDEDRLGRLLAADPDVVRTVRTYLDLGCSAARTASALTIHRQTLYQRLRRAEELSGLDLSGGEDRLLVHLALVVRDAGSPLGHALDDGAMSHTVD